MKALIASQVNNLRHGMEALSPQERPIWVSDVVALAYAAPLAVIGLYGLIARTDWQALVRQWAFLLLLIFLVAIFKQLSFFTFAEIKTGQYADWGSSLDLLATWSAVLLFGPVALWPGSIFLIVHYIWRWKKSRLTQMTLNQTRRLALDVCEQTLTALIALNLYHQWGGIVPLPGLEIRTFLTAIYATLAWYGLSRLIWLPYFLLAFLPTMRTLPQIERLASISVISRLYVVTELLPASISPFAVLIAGLYVENGLWVYLFTMGGLLMIALLANLFSKAAERSYHRSRELECLEQLGTALIDAPLDASNLPELLRAYVPGMFPDSQSEIRIFPDQVLLPGSPDWPPVPVEMWEWLQSQPVPQAGFYLRGEPRPWQLQPAPNSLLYAPIYSLESGELIGGVCVIVRWSPEKIIPHFLPALQSLATQVSSTLHQAEVYYRSLEHEKVALELRMAGEIQSGLLPKEMPQLPGWQISAALEPARETSGDFYDSIPLPDGHLGILIADVADKGMGAALYMTMTRTLVRTYAMEYTHQPEQVCLAVHRRLLAETPADIFVTAFYGILSPQAGRLDYCNAGHIPPAILKNSDQGSHETLQRTGMALGIIEEATWQAGSIQLAQGDVLLLYTDGISDAQDEQGNFIDQVHLLDLACRNIHRNAREIQEVILNEVHHFAGEPPLMDDIAIIVMKRCL